jgi:hypothetical protein
MSLYRGIPVDHTCTCMWPSLFRKLTAALLQQKLLTVTQQKQVTVTSLQLLPSLSYCNDPNFVHYYNLYITIGSERILSPMIYYTCIFNFMPLLVKTHPQQNIAVKSLR